MSLLLIIDPQNDFVNPAGALPVAGAAEDMQRLNAFIDSRARELKHILVTLDTHHPVHIATPDYWSGPRGEHPEPYTVITPGDLRAGRWMPLYHKENALPYLEALTAQGKNHTIWPPHCLYGTEGWAVWPALYEKLDRWSREEEKSFTLYTKGESSEDTEMFSVVKPEVSLEKKDTARAEHFLSLLEGYERIYIAGEAENFCVRESVRDIAALRPQLVRKLTVLRSCMSAIPVPGSEMEAFWGALEEKGARIIQ